MRVQLPDHPPEHHWHWLSSPVDWDAVANDIDQERFQSLFENHLDDPVVRCRKAELLIRLYDHGAAAELLRDVATPLAAGLRAKLATCEGDLELAEKLTAAGPPPGSGPLDLEGAIHVYEARAWASFRRARYAQSLADLYRAEALAAQLGLRGRLAILGAHLDRLALHTGAAPRLARREAGNVPHDRYQRENTVTALLLGASGSDPARLARELEAAGAITPDEERLVEATAQHHARNDHGAALLAFDCDPEPTDLRIYWGLLTLGIAARTGLLAGEEVDRALEAIRGLERLKDPQKLLAMAYRIYPLGLYLAAGHPEFEELLTHSARQVPVLQNRTDAGKDGIHTPNGVHTITRSVRVALMLDGLTGGSEHYRELTRDRTEKWRQTRYRAQLRAAGLEPHQFIAATEAYRGFLALGRLSGVEGFAQAAARIRRTLPGVRRAIRQTGPDPLLH